MSDLKVIKDFIFNDEVQDVLSKIDDRLMDFNILEITSMGNQEIKHSNVLSWLFSDKEHELGYKILNDFLKKVVAQNNFDALNEYLYLSKNNQDITIYREKDNIDLLIVDKNNKPSAP